MHLLAALLAGTGVAFAPLRPDARPALSAGAAPLDDASGVDFGGTWTRVRSVGLEAALEAKGRSVDEARAMAAAPYATRWERSSDPLVWRVTAAFGAVPSSTGVERPRHAHHRRWRRTA